MEQNLDKNSIAGNIFKTLVIFMSVNKLSCFQARLRAIGQMWLLFMELGQVLLHANHFLGQINIIQLRPQIAKYAHYDDVNTWDNIFHVLWAAFSDICATYYNLSACVPFKFWEKFTVPGKINVPIALHWQTWASHSISQTSHARFMHWFWSPQVMNFWTTFLPVIFL